MRAELRPALQRIRNRQQRRFDEHAERMARRRRGGIDVEAELRRLRAGFAPSPQVIPPGGNGNSGASPPGPPQEIGVAAAAGAGAATAGASRHARPRARHTEKDPGARRTDGPPNGAPAHGFR